jgi:hypothetical protein
VNNLPEYIINMIRRSAPKDCNVVQNSTPVVSFGDFRKARVATLGINPSDREFLDTHGRLLVSDEQRLPTTISIGTATTSNLSDEQVQEMLDGCSNYFHRNPYMAWFGHLEKVLQPGLGASYRDGSACHLDLVQWATKPKWSSLDKQTQNVLLEDGTEHLRNQLLNEKISLVVVNGASVWNELKRTKFLKFEDVGRLTFSKNNTPCTLRAGSLQGVKFLGWSTNIQNSFGGTEGTFLQQLAEWLRDESN